MAETKERKKIMINFLNLEKINNRYRVEIDRRISSILDKGWYLQGEWDEAFEEHFATYCGAKHCIGCANGLEALILIIRAYGFGKRGQHWRKCNYTSGNYDRRKRSYWRRHNCN